MMGKINNDNSLRKNQWILQENISHYNTVNSNEHSNIDINSRYEVPGYDTISYWVDQSDVPEMDLMAELPCKMDQSKEKVGFGGRIYVHGKINGITVDVYKHGVFIRLSLPILILGNNIESLSLDRVKDAHAKISSLIGFSIYKVRVTRIDISATFIVQRSFSEYLSALGPLSRFNIKPYKNGRYYSNRKGGLKVSPICLLFYNKLKEQKNKGIEANVDFINSFRYEIRFKKLKQTLAKTQVTPADLEDLIFFKSLVSKWLKYFNKITIYNDLKFDVNFLKDSKTFSSFFISYGIREFGQERLLNNINEQMRAGAICRQSAYRYQSRIKLLMTNNELSVNNELIKELQMKINNASLFYA